MNCGAKFFPDEKGSDLFSCAAGCLRSEFGSFENAWAKACADFFPKTPCLREKDIECISGIGKALGLANTQRQSAHIASVVKKLFSAKLGCGAMEFFSSLKIERAKKLIREDSRNITEIAEALSYSSVYYFSRAFKKSTGMTPTEYAASVKAMYEEHNVPIPAEAEP